MVYRPVVDEQFCFVLMPFQEIHVEYFRGIIAPAVAEVGLTAKKADDIYGTAPIIQDIWQSIWAAKAVVADVTGRNPNVNYELGICHSLGVPTVLVTQDLADVPFDYRHRRCILYDTRRVEWQSKLKRDIVLTLKAVLAGESVSDDLRWPYDTFALRPSRTVGSFISAEEAREPVLKGISLVADAVARAFGPHGTTVSISPGFGGGYSNGSGVVIASATESGNPLEQKGIERARALAREASSTYGDGTKAAVLIFREMLKHAFEALDKGVVLRDLVHEMDQGIELTIASIGTQTRPATTEDILAVARTAAAGDLLSAQTVQDAIKKTGADSITYIADSPDSNTSVEVREGMYFDAGFLDPRFVTDESKQLAALENAYILLYNGKISSMRDMLPLLEQVAKKDAALLIIADDLVGEAIETLVINKNRGTLRCAAAKAPGFAANRWALLEDIAVSTGGMVLGQSSRYLQDALITQLGQARRVEVSKDTTWILGGLGNKALIESRAAALRSQIELAKGTDRDVDRLRERLARLVGSVCAIRVGGVSSVDKDERKYKIRTARHSVEYALSHGVVPGGGLALLRAAEDLKRKEPANVAFGVVARALEVSIRTQLANANVDIEETIQMIKTSNEISEGFDAEARVVGDLRKKGILDPSKTTTGTLQLAFAHARVVLQTGGWDLTERPPQPAPHRFEKEQ